MTREEQDKLWAELSEESKEQMKEKFNKNIEVSDPNAEYFRGIRYQTGLIFGSHNLQAKQTYEDVAKELFEEGAWQFGDGYMNDEYGYFDENANKIFSLNMTSQKQAKKLIALNMLLNVAKFLNKNNDGSDWVPDWEDDNEKKWELIINRDNVLIGYCITGNTSPVYFRTEKLLEQAIEILGEKVIRTALGNY